MMRDEIGSARHTTVAAGHGESLSVAAGNTVRIVNTHGSQVVDFWAYAADRESCEEYLSMPHCIEVLQKVHFRPGDVLVTNRYRPALTILADTSCSDHDALVAACSPAMYEVVGLAPDHRSCTENHREVCEFKVVGDPPQPWNLFMLAPIDNDGSMTFLRPHSQPGDYVELRAELDLEVILSSCPDDYYPTNGGDGAPRDIEVIVTSS